MSTSAEHGRQNTHVPPPTATYDELKTALLWTAAASLLAALAFLMREILNLSGPVSYWNPKTATDYASVILFSLAIRGSAATLWLMRIAWLKQIPAAPGSQRRLLNIVLSVAAAAALTNGLANAVEDGLGMKWAGSVFVLSVLVLVMSVAHLVVAAVSWKTSRGTTGPL